MAHAEFHDQTDAIPNTVLFTPQHDGLFRVSAYLIVTVEEQDTCGGGSMNVSTFLRVLYTDDSGQNLMTIAQGGLNGAGTVVAGGPSEGPDVFQAKAGTPIGFAVPVVFTQQGCTLTVPPRSLGAVWGPVLTAVEPRLKVSILAAGGLPFEKLPSEIEPLNFAPRVKIPTLMLNGRDDFIYPVESSQVPLFHLLGVPPAQKRHLTFESGHVPPWQPVMKESLAWLDRYL